MEDEKLEKPELKELIKELITLEVAQHIDFGEILGQVNNAGTELQTVLQNANTSINTQLASLELDTKPSPADVLSQAQGIVKFSPVFGGFKEYEIKQHNPYVNKEDGWTMEKDGNNNNDNDGGFAL